jgi:hypothetical protein
MVFGNLSADEMPIQKQISSEWETGGLRASSLSSPDSGGNFILISTKTSQNLFIGSLIKEESFLFPWNLKVILLLSFFFFFYLSIFLLLSLKQDPLTIIQDRLKKLQISLLEQFYELRNDRDWDRWIRELENRKEETNALVKQGIRSVSGSQKEKIDTLINKSWNELLSLLGSRREPGFSEEKLRSAINSLLAALPKTYRDMFPAAEESSMPKPGIVKTKIGLLGRASAIVKEIEEAELVEEIEEIDDSRKPAVDIAALASQIEFSPEPEPETDEDDPIERDLEIVSPFSAMLDGFTDKVESQEAFTEEQNPEGGNNVITEKEGLPFISAEALNQDEKKENFTNPEFKNLVDSVIKN